MMKKPMNRYILTPCLAFGLALAATLFSSGCGASSSDGATAARISPEMEKKTQEMLKNYGQQYHEKNRGSKGKRR